MKKILAMLLALCMLVSLAACGGDTTSSTASTAESSSAAESSTVEESSEPAESSEEPVDDGEEEEIPDAASLLSDAFVNPVGSDWQAYDAMIKQIKAETDMAARADLMHQAEDVLMANGGVIPIYYYNDIFLMKDYVQGFYNAPLGTKYFMYTYRTDGETTLRLNLASEPDYLDPTLNSSADGSILAANSFSGLYNYGTDGQLQPACAAEMFTVSDDGLHYTVKLKEGLKWNDGSDLNANDFVYSWKRAANEETAADYAYMFDVFQGYPNDLAVVATDDLTLEFDLNAPCAYMGDLMAFTTYLPVQQASVEAFDDYTTNPGHWAQEAGFVSNGAFKCVEWKHNESMVYEKNPYWYDADKVQIERIELMLSADDTAIYAAYNSGNIDFADAVPTDEVANLLDNPEFHIIDQLGTYYCAFNVKSPIFDGKTPEQAACMRLAFSKLIDRDYICENIGQTGQIAANAYIPVGMADGNGGLFKADIENSGYYDPYAINNNYEETIEEARTLLKAAGFKFDEDGTLSDETPISIEYLTNESSGHIAIAEAIQQDLGVVGIELTIQTEDWAVFLEERKQGNYDFAREGWLADFNDPINMLEMFATDSGNNDPQFGR